MKRYDYSGLIKVIGEIKTNQKKAINERLLSHTQQLLDLENKVISSGMLEDWENLKNTCKKAGVCLNISNSKYDNYKGHGGFADFATSSHNFLMYNFGFRSNNEGLIWQWDNSQAKFENEEYEIKTKMYLLNKFLDTYQEYREIQLQRIIKKMGDIVDNTKKIRKEI